MIRRIHQDNPQHRHLQGRLPVVIGLMVTTAVYLLWQLVSFQTLPPQVSNYLRRQANFNYTRTLQLAAQRGAVYDRQGQPLAVNTLEYEIGVSPDLVANKRAAATALAGLLPLSDLAVFEALNRREPWVSLAKPVSAEVAQRIVALNQLGITVDPLPKRLYPQGSLAAQLIGFVAGADGSAQGYRGYNGVEGYYEDELAGRISSQQVSTIPFDLPADRTNDGRGSDLVLTIDRDVQYLVETELANAIREHNAEAGTIIVMDPRTGDILAMASYPTFDPNRFLEVQDARQLSNPAISSQYEPGSVMKVLTVAAGIESGTIGAADTYLDNGAMQVGGITVRNWDRQAYGVVNITRLLVDSLNVGAATISTSMGPTRFYQGMASFSMGRATGVDLEGEAIGIMPLPGSPQWSESQLATNSFGQGVSVTPLQMITSVSAIANGGLMMQPHIVHQIVDGNQVYTSQPSALGRPISNETAQALTEMMVRVVEDGSRMAMIPGYTVAGKTGTAQIPTPLGYEGGATIVSFVGFLPADDPQIIVLIKLDRPSGYWGSQVAAPVFSRLASRLVLMLEIPPDDVRRALRVGNRLP